MSTIFDDKENIWRGSKKSQNYSSTNIASKCLSVLMEDPDNIALILHPSGREYTNREIVTMSIQIAQHFRDHLKIAPGTVIGLCAENSDYVVPLFFGSLLAGLILNPIAPKLDKPAIKHMYSITQPSIVLCDGDVYRKVSEAIDEIQLKIPIYTMKRHIIGVPAITEFLHSTVEATFRPDDWHIGSKQTGLILCSSGTTGLPKAICISHDDMLYTGMEGVFHFDDIFHQQYGCLTTNLATPFKRKSSFTGLYWLTGYTHIVTCAIKKSTNVALEEGLSLQVFFDMVEQYKIDWILTPTSVVACLAADPQLKSRDLSSLRLFATGGSSIIMSQIEKVKASLPNAMFLALYGLTESSLCSRGLPSVDCCVGELLENIEVKIIDDMGKRLGPNERGEICIKSPYTGMKYYKNPEANANTFIDGWVHSGDIGYFNEDNYLYVVDRKKEILRGEFFDIAPSELEAIIYELNGVAEVCVFGRLHATKITLPAAAVILTPGSELTEKDIRDYVAENTVEYKHLEGGVFILPNALPKTITGKIIRKEVFNICEPMWQIKVNN